MLLFCKPEYTHKLTYQCFIFSRISPVNTLEQVLIKVSITTGAVSKSMFYNFLKLINNKGLVIKGKTKLIMCNFSCILSNRHHRVNLLMMNIDSINCVKAEEHTVATLLPQVWEINIEPFFCQLQSGQHLLSCLGGRPSNHEVDGTISQCTWARQRTPVVPGVQVSALHGNADHLPII